MTWTSSDISVVSISYGPYWELFSEQFFATTGPLDPKPAKIVLVTDIVRETPDWIEQHTLGEGLPLYAYYTEAMRHVESEWTWGCGFDDLMEVDALHDFDSDADIHGHPEHMSDGGYCAYRGGYESMHNGGPNPMVGSFFHRTALLREIPWREHDFADWTQFSECAHFGKTLSMEDRPIATWARHPLSASLQWNPTGVEEVWSFQEALRSGRVPYPGSPVTELAAVQG